MRLAQAHDQIVAILRRVAGARGTTTYSDLAPQVSAIPGLRYDGDLLPALLDEVSRAEAGAERGMLSAVVVHKNDDDLPGEGFFKLARELGRDTSDQLAFYVAELNLVYESNSRGR
jgi:hypothetical protein